MKHDQSHPDSARRLENGRLLYFENAADKDHWEELWSQTFSPDFYAPFLEGSLAELEQAFTKYLPGHGLILEAGCGLGQYVMALRQRGYNCLGVDFAAAALRRANRVCRVPVFGGDLLGLGLANASLDAIISLGVVEHRREGPEPFLEEMTRVLKPGGRLLISVPYFHPLRRWRAARGAYQGDIEGLVFYQQAFTREEFQEIVAGFGYEILDWMGYSHRKGLRQEWSWLTRIGAWPGRVFFKMTDYLPYASTIFGHMQMLIARKPL